MAEPLLALSDVRAGYGDAVVLDEQHRDVARQAGDDLEQLGALVARHAGGRLVEQQHARAQRERERDLEQALAAIG